MLWKTTRAGCSATNNTVENEKKDMEKIDKTGHVKK